jgi:hypothetical protein
MKSFEDLECWKRAAALNGYINYLGKAKSDFGVKEPEVTYQISPLGTYSTDN